MESAPALAARAAALAALLSFTLAAAQAQPWRFEDVERVVVVADVHGAYPALVELLETTGIVDADLAWSGGNAHLVSLGDLLDRGPESRRVMELLMRLEDEAASHGGRVHVVLGNHEVMNLTGDLRYVSAEEYAAFAPDETAEMRVAALAALAELAAAAAGRADPPGAGAGEAGEAAAIAARYPPGYFAHRAAFAPEGRYGEWLLSLPAVVVVDDTAFVHGGLSELAAATSLEALNGEMQETLGRYLALRGELAAAGVLPPYDMSGDAARAHAALAGADPALARTIEDFIAAGDARVLGLDGPLWYRGSVYCKPMLEAPVLDAALERLEAARVVVGHTPTGDRRARALHGGKLVVLDTGMLADYYAGRPAALVLEGGDMYVQYAAPAERGSLETGAADAYGFNEAELHEALARGAVTAVERGAEDAPSRVVLEYDDAAIEALFYAQSGALELAAAALDGLLGTALVPPTVGRRIEGEDGALQLRYPDAITEEARVERRLGIGTWCPIEPQLELLYTFDVLTLNRGRSAANVLYTSDLSNLVATDYGLAFGTARALPQGFDAALRNPPAALVEALGALDASALEAALGEHLDTRRQRALLARRDRLLEAWD